MRSAAIWPARSASVATIARAPGARSWGLSRVSAVPSAATPTYRPRLARVMALASIGPSTSTGIAPASSVGLRP